MARQAGVSTATVSRVVHGHDRVRPSTRQRVLGVIEALGYVPDSAAQSMVRKRKEVIGLVAIESRGRDSDIEQDGLLFMEEVLRGVESPLSQVGWSVLISVLRSADETDAYRWLQKISAKVDGMLIAEGIVPSQQLARLAARIPVTLVAGSPEEPSADVIQADNRVGTEALVRHMVEQHGKTRLYYVAGPPEAPDARERRSVFEQTLAGYQGVRLEGCFEGRFAAVSGQLAVRGLLAARHGELPDAIVCGNDQMAIGAMRELHTAGIRVPGRHRRGRVRRHAPGRLAGPDADHRAPADAAARRARLLHVARPHRRPGPPAPGGAAGHHARRAGKLRLHR